MRFLLIFLIFFGSLHALDFNLIKKGESENNNTLLVIGGIHGNEPGGYFSANILASHYKITSGTLWVVPNLNAKSIQADKRGIYGDMNRKFANINPKDPDFEIVSQIKQLILDKNVSLIINLHDGHGFYREKNEGTIFNPHSWGQTCVIDQCNLTNNSSFYDMDKLAHEVKTNLNKKLIEDRHIFNVKNTNTKFDDEEMAHSLTYFAVTHNKPAFAIETSKNLSTLSQKIYYQLNAIEKFMDIMGIKYERDFILDQNEIENIINENGSITINENILLNLNNIKKSLSFIPLQSSGNKFVFSNSIGSINSNNSSFDLYIGNKKVTTIHGKEFNKCQDSDTNISIIADGKTNNLKFASNIFVDDDFTILKSKRLRVNVIGFTDKIHKDESNLKIDYKSLDKSYAIDDQKKSYRVEFYDKNAFCGMIVVNFR
jgi:hypothetical protein